MHIDIIKKKDLKAICNYIKHLFLFYYEINC